MRDEETVRTALSAAETGHLVLSTVHTLDATETINRIIDFFPPHLQHQARVMLAATLKGAIAQRLVPDITGNGRVPASEVMVVTGRVQDLIMNPEETGKITEVIGEGEYYGMRTFDQSLLTYVMEGKVSEEVALDYASSPHDFKLMLAAGGQRASGIEQLNGEPEQAPPPPPPANGAPQPLRAAPPPPPQQPPAAVPPVVVPPASPAAPEQVPAAAPPSPPAASSDQPAAVSPASQPVGPPPGA
jgi:twitching motility protein PilT